MQPEYPVGGQCCVLAVLTTPMSPTRLGWPNDATSKVWKGVSWSKRREHLAAVLETTELEKRKKPTGLYTLAIPPAFGMLLHQEPPGFEKCRETAEHILSITGIPSLSVCVIHREKPVYTAHHGLRDKSQNPVPDGETRYNIN